MSGRGLLAAASLALCLGGMATVTDGVAVPVKARLAQAGLERIFERRLTEHRLTERQLVQHRLAEHRAERAVAPSRRVPRAAPALPARGPVARITVERLGVKEYVLAGEPSHERLAQGPTLLKAATAASPVAVLAAHRDTHFRFIRDLREGDEMTLELVTGERQRYRIARFETVRWDAFAYPLDPARPLLALTTCFPFDGTEYGGPWRRVAWAERIG